MNKIFDVLAIGNALVDISSKVSNRAYTKINATIPMEHGKFNPVDVGTSERLLTLLKKPVETGGGSSANTMLGLASFGGSAGFLGRIGQDRFGDFFRGDLRTNKVHPMLSDCQGGHTGRCIVLVTPDGERTMNTYLGAAAEYSPFDVEAAIVASAKILMLEGYMLDSPSARQAYNRAAGFAIEAKTQIALTLSSEFCIQGYHDEMLDLAHKDHGIVFANEDESKAFARTGTFQEAVPVIAELFETAALTCGKKGAVIVHKGKITEIPVEPIVKLKDTTGAGDQFAAGFLYGYTHGMSMAHCGRLGALAAAEVIQHTGPRPQIAYKTFLNKLG